MQIVTSAALHVLRKPKRLHAQTEMGKNHRDETKTPNQHHYAPVTIVRGHKYLPLSVRPPVCLSVRHTLR